MAKQLFFYDSAVPVSKERHSTLRITPATYKFAAEVNAVPLTSIEIPMAAREYAIVFAGQETVTPMVLLGIEKNQNLYVRDDGSWNADYIPAFVRRYPFVFSLSQDEKQFALCVDEAWDGCTHEGDEGKRLFDDAGEQTEYLKQMLNFLQEYQIHFNRTKTFCEKLKTLDLLDQMKADFKLADGTERSLGGFMAVNREKLKGLAPDALADLLKTDELEIIFDHLLSMNNLNEVTSRKMKRDE